MFEREREREREGEREGGREGGRDGGREGRREEGRDGGNKCYRVSQRQHQVMQNIHAHVGCFTFVSLVSQSLQILFENTINQEAIVWTKQNNKKG